MEDDLQRFRAAWIAEVNEPQNILSSVTDHDNEDTNEHASEKSKDSKAEAVEAYINASNYERMENFHAAMTEYRRGLNYLLTSS
jgi:hypothetical protein